METRLAEVDLIRVVFGVVPFILAGVFIFANILTVLSLMQLPNIPPLAIAFCVLLGTVTFRIRTGNL